MGYRWKFETQQLDAKLVRLSWRIISACFFLPLYLLPRRGRPVRVKAINEMHPLAYTDALRGYLAMIIYTGHCVSSSWGWIPKSILAIPWLQFPVRGGIASVQMFYWISGYTVTYKIMGLIQTKQTGKLHDALASAVFRRYLRLFLPILPLILVTAIGVRLGIVQPGEAKKELVGNNPIWFWIKDCGHFLNPFTAVSPWYAGNGEGSHLLFHTWSINTEFRSSMIKFAVCLGLSKIPTANRKIFYWLAIPALTAWQAHYASMAFIGMWFAECRQERNLAQKSSALNDLDSNEMQDLSEKRGFSSRSVQTVTNFNSREPDRITKCILFAIFLYSFVVMQNPNDTDKMRLFPHNYLNLLVPEHWHESMTKNMHLGIGSVMMLYPLDRLTFLQKPLLLPFSQFLGELSFGIYAVHITVRWTVWDSRYEGWAKARYGDHALDKFWVVFPSWCVLTIVVLWCAEFFRRLDWRVVRFCNQLEKMMFEQ